MPSPFSRTRPSGAAGDRRFRVTMRFSHNGVVNPITGWSGVTKSTLVPPGGQSAFSTALGNALAGQFGTGNPVSGPFLSLGASPGTVGDRGASGHAIVLDLVDDGRRFADAPSTADRTYIAEKVARAFAAAVGGNVSGASDLVAAARSGGSSGAFRFDGIQVAYTPRGSATSPTPAPPPPPAPTPTQAPPPAPTPTLPPMPTPPPAPAPITPADLSTVRPVAPAPATESQRAAARDLAAFVAAAAPGLLVSSASRAIFNSTVERLQRAMGGGITVDGLYGGQTRTRMESLGVSAPLARAPNSTPIRTVTESDQRVVTPSQASALGVRLSTGVIFAAAVGVLAVGAAVAYATSDSSTKAPALPARALRPTGRRSGR